MGLPSSLDGIADPDCSDVGRNEKLLRTELEGVERGEALGLRGAWKLFEAASTPGFLAESSSNGHISERFGQLLTDLLISDDEDGPT